MDRDQPKTRQEKGKGKGGKTKEVYNQKSIRLKEALVGKGLERQTSEKRNKQQKK